MKTLLVLRHGKAERPEIAGIDFDRQLTARGRRDARAVGEWLAAEGLQPDLVVTSSAARALQTAELAAESAEVDDPPVAVDALYGADEEACLAALREHAEGEDTVLLVGHNPTLEALVERLTGRDVRLRTAELAHVESDVETWADIGRGRRGRLVAAWRPAKEG